jgi:hypothetical protein
MTIDRYAAAARRQFLLQAQAVHAGHADVDQQAAGPRGCHALQEGLGAGEHRRAIAAHAQQQAERVAHGGIVVDDEYGQISGQIMLRHSSPFSI